MVFILFCCGDGGLNWHKLRLRSPATSLGCGIALRMLPRAGRNDTVSTVTLPGATSPCQAELERGRIARQRQGISNGCARGFHAIEAIS